MKKRIFLIGLVLFLVSSFCYAQETDLGPNIFDLGVSFIIGGGVNAPALHFQYVGYLFNDFGLAVNMNVGGFGGGIADADFVMDFLFGVAWKLKINNFQIPMAAGMYFLAAIGGDIGVGAGINASYYYNISNNFYLFGRVQIGFCLGMDKSFIVFTPSLGGSISF